MNRPTSPALKRSRRPMIIAVSAAAAIAALTGTQSANAATTPRTTVAQAKIRDYQATIREPAATIHVTHAMRVTGTPSGASARLSAAPAAAATSITLFDGLNDVDDIAPGTGGDEWFVDHRLTEGWISPGCDSQAGKTFTTVVPAIGRVAAAGTIRYYHLPASVTSVSDLAAGTSDTVWFVENDEPSQACPPQGYGVPLPGSTATLVRMTSSGRTTGYSLPVAEAGAITRGPDGSLWIAGITPAGATEILDYSGTGIAAVFTGGGLPDGGAGRDEVCGLTVGGDGRLWISTDDTEAGSPPPYKIYAMNSAGETTSYTVDDGDGYLRICNLVTGPDGNVWFPVLDVSDSDGNTIGKITPDGAVTIYSSSAINISEDNSTGQALLTAGPDGALWFVNDDGQSIGRITVDGTVTNVTLPAQHPWDSGINSITTGTDGALWFTPSSGGPIGRLTTGGTLTAFPGPGITGTPDVAAGPGNSVWFATQDGYIGLATPAGKTSLFTIPDGLFVQDGHEFAAGADGSVWFNYASEGGNATYGNNGIGHLTSSGVLTLYSVPALSAYFPTLAGIALGSHGTVWFASAYTSQIFAMTSSGHLTAYSSAAISAPDSMAAGSGGAIWFANYGNDTVAKITPSGHITSYYGYAINVPNAVAAAPNGSAVWFGDGSNDTIGELKPSGAITFVYLGMPDSEPTGIAFQPDGTAWIAQTADAGVLALRAYNCVTRVAPGGTVTNLYTANPWLGLTDQVAATGTSTIWIGDYITGLVKITTS